MDDDALLRASARNMAAMWDHVARSCDGRTQHWDDAWAADAGAPNAVVNRTTIQEPKPDPAELAERVHAFYGSATRPYGVVDPFDAIDLAEHGFVRITHMPCMTLPAGAAAPADPEGVIVSRVTDDDGLRAFKTALFNGFTLVSWPSVDELMTSKAYADDGVRLWVATAEGSPVGCSVSVVAHGIVGVYLVATIPEARGRRVGEAVSWAAALAEPNLPAVLQASQMGLPVYQRMGFREIARVPFWFNAAGQR